MPFALPSLRQIGVILTGIGLAALVFLLVLTKADARHLRRALDSEKTAHALDIEKWNAASAKAEAAAQKAARATEAFQARASQESNDDIEAQLAAARAAARAHAAGHLSDGVRAAPANDQGNARGADLPATSRSSGSADAAGGASELAARDDTACAEAVTKAEGWQAWWRRIAGH